MAKGKSLLDDVLARATNKPPGFRSWFDRLPAEAQAELAEVRERFHAGGNTIQKRAYAAAIMDAAKERGWKTSGIQGVLAWLNARN